MNWCKPHWQQLREALKAKGLDGFGAQTGEEAAAEIASQLEGNEESFDPLLGCWSRVNAAMAESLTSLGRGHEILQLRCPLCILVDDGQPHTVANWIDGVTEEARMYAVHQGLIKTQ